MAEAVMKEIIPANDVPFEKLCTLLEELYNRRIGKNQEQNTMLTDFINEFRINTANIQGKKNATFSPIMRLLLPEQDRERPAYNLKQIKLGELLVKILAIKNTRDASKLKDFRSGNSSHDFASSAYFVIKSRMGGNSGNLTIGQINEILDKIATAEVGNKTPILDEAFTYAIKNLTPDQMKWFLRLILKDLKLGMGLNRTLTAFHPDAPDLYKSSSSLEKVCEELEDGNTRPLELGVQMFYAVSPMLSERLDVTKVDAVLSQNKTYTIEEKFDGERFQMHMENDVFEYYSRKGHTYGDHYGRSYDTGLLTKYLKDCFSPSVHSFVLDGEMMGWHKHYQCFGSKAMPYDIKKITERSAFRPCYRVFDVVYYNGRSIAGPPERGGLPLRERRKILESMFKDIPGFIMISNVRERNNNADMLDALNKAIFNQEEGIVVKDVASYYIANKRNAGWYKIKAEYTENAMNDMDLVIIGADQAENKRQGRAKSFHVACADAVATGTAPHRWLSIGRVATGFTYEERERVCSTLEKHWVSSKHSSPPQSLVFNKEKPHFWIMPEHSIVVTVRATELIRTSGYGTEYTMNFPRIVRLRDDKKPTDIMTLDEFNKLIVEKRQVVKLTHKRGINPDQMDELASKTRKTRAGKEKQVPEQFRARPTGGVEVTSKALLGRKVHVLLGDEDCDRHQLAKIIESHSGKYVENSGPDTWCSILGNKRNFRVESILKSPTLDMDIISASWLRALPPSDEQFTLSPLDMIAMRTATKLSYSRQYDRFGDSYTEPIDVDTLKKVFEKMETTEPPTYLTRQEILEIESELFGIQGSIHSFLRPCVMHFTNKNTLLEWRAKMYGATMCESNSNIITHIVVSKETQMECLDMKIMNSGAVIVFEDWLEKCISEQKLVEVNGYVANRFEGIKACDL